MTDLIDKEANALKLTAASRPAERSVLRIPIDSIRPSPYQPRRTFPEESIAGLAQSIRLQGLLSPLLVRRVDTDRFELIAGERRLRALKMLGRAQAEVIVLSAYDCDCALISLIENLQREDLHYLDAAEACRAILSEHDMTQDALARSLAVSPSALANRLRLLKLPASVRDRLRVSGLSERHARALLRLTAESDQMLLASEAQKLSLSVKQLENRVEQLLREKQSSTRRISPVVRDNRIVINAVLDTVRELRRIGVRADSRVEERPDGVDVIVTIRTEKAEPR